MRETLVDGIMTIGRILHSCSWCFLVLIPSISSSLTQAQLMSFCNQSLNVSSMSLLFTPPTAASSSSCCNITFVRSSSSQFITMNILNLSTSRPVNQQMGSIKFSNYSSSSNRSYLKSDILPFPVHFSLCQLDLPPFELLITNISRGPCRSTEYRCVTSRDEQWCIDDTYRCDGYHSCPQGMDEDGCTKSSSTFSPLKSKRTIRGGIVTTIMVLGLLLIVASVSIALAFVYFRRKNQRQRHFTYSLESTSDDWEPSGTGYHLFDNWTKHRSTTNNQVEQLMVDANEHMPITTSR